MLCESFGILLPLCIWGKQVIFFCGLLNSKLDPSIPMAYSILADLCFIQGGYFWLVECQGQGSQTLGRVDTSRGPHKHLDILDYYFFSDIRACLNLRYYIQSCEVNNGWGRKRREFRGILCLSRAYTEYACYGSNSSSLSKESSAALQCVKKYKFCNIACLYVSVCEFLSWLHTIPCFNCGMHLNFLDIYVDINHENIRLKQVKLPI